MAVIDRTPPPPGSPSAELIHACVEGNLVGCLRRSAMERTLTHGGERRSGHPFRVSLAATVEALIEAGADARAKLLE